MRFGTRLALSGVVALILAGPSLASPADNKAAAINAMTDLFSKQDTKGVDRYFNTTAPYRQHNMRIADGLDALRRLAQEATTWKGVHTTIYRGLADKDLVVLHSVYRNLGNRPEQLVAFDLFRFDKAGKIIEHWDALQPVVAAGPAGPTQFDGPVKILDRGKTEANRAAVTGYIEASFLKLDAKGARGFLASKGVVEHHTGVAPFLGAPPSGPPGAGKPAPAVSYLKIHRTVAEGNFVFVQSEGRLGGDTILEIYDLFRLENGKIAEHWDVHQPVPVRAQWANANGPF